MLKTDNYYLTFPSKYAILVRAPMPKGDLDQG